MPKVRPGKATQWSTLKKRQLAKITPANIEAMAQRWQIRQPVVTQEDVERVMGLVMTGKKVGRRVVYDPPRPDVATNIISAPGVE